MCEAPYQYLVQHDDSQKDNLLVRTLLVLASATNLSKTDSLSGAHHSPLSDAYFDQQVIA